ncbi:hypothetical protein GCM10027449_13610 [Sinomonas notoginsengisoli]|uniref:hypothetical protein n=1 Tax=Sinomonas notoginsengisoli TaxID=1457311 RepID=UPI001F26C069|nr:hypothetical protein [Sinomonas notoginsengisoli]
MRRADNRANPAATAKPATPEPTASTATFLSHGAVGHLSRQLVERMVGRDPSVHAWRAGGPLLPGEPPPGELARRLCETEIAFLTAGELEAYVSACASLRGWAEAREGAARTELAARDAHHPEHSKDRAARPSPARRP